MLVKKIDALLKVNSENCKVLEYETPFKGLNLAIAELSGRYPESGKAINTECDMIYFVLSGNAKIYTEDGYFNIEKDDLFHFEKNKWYYLEANNLKIVIPSSPAWFLEQYKMLE